MLTLLVEASTSLNRKGIAGALRRRTRALRRQLAAGLAAHPGARPHRAWLIENGRLIAGTVKEVQELAGHTFDLPVVSADGAPAPRVCVLAQRFLESVQWQFEQEAFVDYLRTVQEQGDLALGEIWAAKPALQLALAERLVSVVTTTGGDEIPVVITSLRAIADAQWKEVFAAVNVVDPVLAADPAGAYCAMEEESRERYRRMISELALHCRMSERQVARHAVALARSAPAAGGRAAERRRHVGYYLVDEGVHQLRQRIGYAAPLRQQAIDVVRAHATPCYLGAVALTTAALVGPLVLLVDSAWGVVAALLLMIPALQAAIDLVNTASTSLMPPRALPKLDFEMGVPGEHATLVAVPALLINEQHVRDLVMDMEIRYLANRDRNIMFTLVTNSRDSHVRPREDDQGLRLCQELVAELNQRYGTDGHTPFYLLHRFRAFNPSERRWIGWERKRGKLFDLNQLLRGVRDRFPVKVGNVAALHHVRYVIVLDSDTELPRDAARRLVGTMAHPLNRAVVDPATMTVVEGYGILQPRISVSTRSAVRSWLANLYSGDTGFDIYTRAVSDVYQDLFAEGIFTGKGIYEVDVFRDSLERRFPANTLLSHDLIEGLFARAGLVSDVELVDDYPSHFSAYCRRRHRWMRGDWQILRWLLDEVPDYQHRRVANPLGAIARWKIFDNLRRTLVELSTLALLVVAWVALPSPGAWTVAAVALLLAPTYARLLLSILHAPWWTAAFVPWARATITGFLRSHVVVALHLVYLVHDALLSLDAIGRALVRMFVTRQRLLEWETAAEASMKSRGATDVYLEWSPIGAAAFAVLLGVVRPEALPAASPLLVAWMAARGVARWLNRPPRQAAGLLTDEDTRFLRMQALRTWTFFATRSTRDNHWLIPDLLREDGQVAERLSPTNLAMLLNARIAAVQFGYLTVEEFVLLTRWTLETVERLPRYRGHLLNWYDGHTLAALEPRFVSTVDSGNLAASLWALKQAAVEFAAQPPADDLLWDGIGDVARVLAEQPDPAARALCERVVKSGAQWRQTLPELEALVGRYAAGADGDARDWANRLLARLRHARRAVAVPVDRVAALAPLLQDIADTSHRLVADMDFGFLYDARRKVLSVGFSVATHQLERSTYDLLASESRIASFVAIAKGDIPQESWLHLGRTHAAVADQRVLVSWTGTLFEYLMPAIWFRHRPRTIMHDSMKAAIAVQRRFAKGRGIPWGFSESAFVVPDADDYGYGPCGLASLSLKSLDSGLVVVSPYSAYLALLVDSGAAMANLRHMQSLGFGGTFGLYEAIDYSRGSAEVVRSWMAHHQGMSLLAISEVLFGHRLQRAFHAEPHVRATERMLEERVPLTIVPDKIELPRVLWPEESAA
ncbi:MAG: glucoamylase family protein [Vicinamibacterales bacterium]